MAVKTPAVNSRHAGRLGDNFSRDPEAPLCIHARQKVTFNAEVESAVATRANPSRQRDQTEVLSTLRALSKP